MGQEDDPLDIEGFFTSIDEDEPLVGPADIERERIDNDHTETIVDLYWVDEGRVFVVVTESQLTRNNIYTVVEPNLTPADHRLVDAVKTRITERLDPEQIATVGVCEIEELAKTVLPDVVESISGDIKPLSEERERKVVYYTSRDIAGGERVDPIMRDSLVESIYCPGYDSRVFIDHSDYGHIVSNRQFGTVDLDEFAQELAQELGQGLSLSDPLLSGTLSDGTQIEIRYKTELTPNGTDIAILKPNTA